MLGSRNRWQIDAAGTIGVHTGDPAGFPDARCGSEKRGFELTSRARQIRAEGFWRGLT